MEVREEGGRGGTEEMREKCGGWGVRERGRQAGAEVDMCCASVVCKTSVVLHTPAPHAPFLPFPSLPPSLLPFLQS